MINMKRATKNYENKREIGHGLGLHSLSRKIARAGAIDRRVKPFCVATMVHYQWAVRRDS